MRLWIITFFIFLTLQALLSQDFKYQRTQVYIGPSKNITNFTFGYNDFLASAFWVRVVQDFHICDQNSERTLYPSFSASGDALSEILNRELPKSTCEKGWVFQMLDVMSDLDPRFRSVYLDGGTMLSVMVDDRAGANLIFQKGIEKFPDDWELLYRTAYHALFEMQNQQEAEKLLYRAAKNGAPQWTYALAAKLSTKTGRAAMALTVLEEVLDRDLGGKYRSRIEGQISELKKILKKTAQ